MQYRLSPSTLNFFLSCRKCFWLAINKKIEMPRGPMPTITNGLDMVIKDYMDRYRPELPLMLRGIVEGKLIEHLPKFLRTEIDGHVLIGKLDECLVMENGHAPLDHKSRGFPPRSVHPAYQLQMDCYSLLLERNARKINNEGYLAYFYPEKGELHDGIPFQVHIEKIETSPERAKQVFRAAIECLKGKEPEGECDVCEYVEKR